MHFTLFGILYSPIELKVYTFLRLMNSATKLLRFRGRGLLAGVEGLYGFLVVKREVGKSFPKTTPTHL